ncbi:MAG: high-affinity iron transporter [Psychromonas sp.]|jgi:high-affinity iron transporter|uniref:FTR1 family iron permease n=1 Tax=Psychromonas sp. TaxID=1884585 RepID=UPI0039E6FACE
MLSSAIIVFREVLEAALVITIVLAATQGVLQRNRWVLGGVAGGLLGALIVAAVADQISSTFDGVGQELLSAAILFSAVLMLAWHNIWMSKHAGELVGHLKNVGKNVSSGQLPMYFLATAIGLAVLREGSEVVLFVYGLAASGSDSISLLAGSVLGLILGSVFGALLYFGLLRIPAQRLFTVTGWMILFLASGMSASAAGFLSQAGWLPAQHPIWNTASLLSEHSVAGQVLHVLIGYQDRPTAIQLSFYVTTFIVITLAMYLSKQRSALRCR